MINVIEEKQRVVGFYTSDEYSRQLPGMKNVKSVKQPNGKRIKIQKRLLLTNFKELYAEYKKNMQPMLNLYASLPPFLKIDRPTSSVSELAARTLFVSACITRT